MHNVVDMIVSKCLFETKHDKRMLETEEQGRAIAATQGRIIGYRNLVDFICAEFHIPQTRIDIIDDQRDEMKLADRNNEEISALEVGVAVLQNSTEWIFITDHVSEAIEHLKEYLITEAEKSRDLDLSQGQAQAMKCYESVFHSIADEVERRDKRRFEMEKRKKESLFPDDDLAAGEARDFTPARTVLDFTVSSSKAL